MSIQSKGRREAKKKLAERERNQAAANPAPKPAVEPHAELRDQQRTLLAGIVRRDGQWVLGMDGRIAGETGSAARVFALIRRAAELHEAKGVPVRLVYSDALRDAAKAELDAQGLSQAEYDRRLAGELAVVPPSAG